MGWDNDEYVREFLDSREKWGIGLSLTAVAGTLLFLAEHPHHPILGFGPVFVGFLGTMYLFVVNSYYKQAECIANEQDPAERQNLKAQSAFRFSGKIRVLGLLSLLAPVVVGLLASLALLGLEPAHCTTHETTPSQIPSVPKLPDS